MRNNFFRILLSLFVLILGPARAYGLVVCVDSHGHAELEFAGKSGCCSDCEDTSHEDHRNDSRASDKCEACIDIPVTSEVARQITLQSQFEKLAFTPIALPVLSAYLYADLIPMVSFTKFPVLYSLPHPTDLFVKKSTTLLI